MKLLVATLLFSFSGHAAGTVAAPNDFFQTYVENMPQFQAIKASCSDPNSVDCLRAYAKAGVGQCSDYKAARENLEKFSDTCSESGFENLTCIQNAASCAATVVEEEGDIEEYNKTMKELGLPEEDSTSDVAQKCSLYGLKDYNSRKSDLGKDLREAQKDLEASQKDLAKAAQEYSKNKRQQVERMGRVQEQMSKLIDENQKDAQDRAKQMGQDIVDLEKQQAAAKTQNLQTQGAIAKVLAQRAADLARLSDAMIKGDCQAKIELLAKKWTLEGAGSVRGSSAALFRNSAEKRRRIHDEYQTCVDTANALRKSTRKQYASDVQSLKEQIKGNDQQIAAIEGQKSQQMQAYQQFMARQQISQTEAYNRANAEVAAINQENAEVESVQQERNKEARKEIEDARKRINDITYSMNNMGRKPRGEKIPSQAISHMKKFMSTVQSFEVGACAPLKDELVKMAGREVVDAYNKEYAKRTSGTGATAGSTATSKAK